MFWIPPITRLLSLRRSQKTAIALFADVCFCFIAVWLAIFLRTESFQIAIWQWLWPGAISCVIVVPLMSYFGVYNEITRYSGPSTLYLIIKVVATYAPVYLLIVSVVTLEGVPRSVGVLQPIILIGFLLNSRLSIRGMASFSKLEEYKKHRNVIIFGADEVGRQLAEAVKKSHYTKLIGFLDNNSDLQYQKINGVEVFAPEDFRGLAAKHAVDDILLTTGAIDKKQKTNLISVATANNVSVKMSPSIDSILDGSIEVDNLKKLQIEDLLGREPVVPKPEIMRENVTNKVVMVTGAGGSIGSELVLQLVGLQPKKIVLIDQNELALYSVLNLVKGISSQIRIDVASALVSVCDRAKTFDVVANYNPETIFHAAAYKHVDIVEKNSLSGFEVNFFGTKNMADAAAESGADVFLLVSSDKAVRPTNVMGATKRLAELYIKHLASRNKRTKFVSVRFGNVLGSSGSVVPVFKTQIEKNGPVTVTHPDIERYFMTISEAANLVVQAGVIGNTGDVLLLDMGDPVKITLLARQMIQLAGRTVKDKDNPNGDIEIIYTGLRPGEKMYEELLIDGRSLSTSHPRIFKAHESVNSLKPFEKTYGKLRSIDHKTSDELLKEILVAAVPEYYPFKEVVQTTNLRSTQA